MPSLMRGGVYVPFTTPLLMIARLRLDDEGRPHALIPALSGGQGYYVVPWPMVPDLISMTVYDRALHEALALIVHLDPNFIRARALEARIGGLCGPSAARSAVHEQEADRGRREGVFCYLVQRLAVQRGRPIADLNAKTMVLPENVAAMRGLADGLDIESDDLVDRMDKWSAQLCLIGIDQPDLRGPVRQQFADLRAMLRMMGEWASNDHPEYVGSAQRCLTAGSAILEMIGSQISRIDRECDDPLAVVSQWQQHAERIKAVIGFVATATQIWHAATIEWRSGAAMGDRHAMRERVGFIETLLPVLAPNDILRYQRNRSEASGTVVPARRKRDTPPPPNDPDAGLREAVLAAENKDAALQAMLCWPFRRLISQAGQRELPGDLPQSAITSLVQHLHKTWSARDVSRFEAVLAAVDDPEPFAEEVCDLRKIVLLMLAEWLSWQGNARQSADDRRPDSVPDLTSEEIYAATLMMCDSHIVTLMGGLADPPIRWITIDTMRHIGATLEAIAATGYTLGCVGALQLIMRELAEPCDLVQTLRHLAAHHGPSITSHPAMRTVVDALIVRLEDLRDSVARAIEAAEGAEPLPVAIGRFAEAAQSGISTMPLKQDGGVAKRVGVVVDEVAQCIRGQLLDRMEAMIVGAFPATPDPFSKDEDGKIAELGEAIDRETLLRIESNLELMETLKTQTHLLGLANPLLEGRKAASRAVEQLGDRLLQAAQRGGAGRAEHAREHVMAIVWLTERTIGAEAANRLRVKVNQVLSVQERRAS